MDITLSVTVSHERMAELAEILASFEAGQAAPVDKVKVTQEQPEAGEPEGEQITLAPPAPESETTTVVELSWLHRQKVTKLKEIAAANGVTLPPKATKDAVIAAIVEATQIPGSLDEDAIDVTAEGDEDEDWGDEPTAAAEDSAEDDDWGDEEAAA